MDGEIGKSGYTMNPKENTNKSHLPIDAIIRDPTKRLPLDHNLQTLQVQVLYLFPSHSRRNKIRKG